MKNEELFERIEAVLDDSEVRYEIEETSGYVEFWTDTAGQDIRVDIEYDGTPEDFVSRFAEYAENYNVDDEVELYVDMRGKSGIPDTIRELINDCEEAKNTLMSIAEKLEDALSEEEMQTLYVSIAVDSRVDVKIRVPKTATKEEIREAAMNEFCTADLTKQEVIGSKAVNCSDENDLLFDFD